MLKLRFSSFYQIFRKIKSQTIFLRRYRHLKLPQFNIQKLLSIILTMDSNMGRFRSVTLRQHNCSSVESSKIKFGLRHAIINKDLFALLNNKVRILIFDFFVIDVLPGHKVPYLLLFESTVEEQKWHHRDFQSNFFQGFPVFRNFSSNCNAVNFKVFGKPGFRLPTSINLKFGNGKLANCATLF